MKTDTDELNWEDARFRKGDIVRIRPEFFNIELPDFVGILRPEKFAKKLEIESVDRDEEFHYSVMANNSRGEVSSFINDCWTLLDKHIELITPVLDKRRYENLVKSIKKVIKSKEKEKILISNISEIGVKIVVLMSGFPVHLDGEITWQELLDAGL